MTSSPEGLSTRPRILLVDDHPIVLDGLDRLLSPRYEVCGRLSSGQELLQRIRELDPDVVVLDYSLPDMDGVKVLAAFEEQGVDVRVVVLTMHEDAEYAARCLRAGAEGYVLKRAATDEIVRAVEAVLEGESFLTASLREPVAAIEKEGGGASEELVLASLTPRQREIIRSVCAGEVAKETASRLGVTRKTVEYHKYRVMRQLGFSNTAQLIHFAVRHGLDG